MRILFLIFILLNVVACQSAKDALTLKKKNNTDEFLVEKKSPLVLPPDYGKLPEPKDLRNDLPKNETDDKDVQTSLIKDGVLKNKILKNSEPSALEKSVLKKIK